MKTEMIDHIEYCSKIGNLLGLTNSNWSIDNVWDFGDKHLYKNIDNGTMLYTEDGEHYYEPILGDTWLDLWVAADKLIKQSGGRHWFIEGFSESANGCINLYTGS